MKFEVRPATGADWVWLTSHVVKDGEAPPPQTVIARMCPTLDEDAAMALPVDEFRDLFHACSRAIVGDDLPD